MKTEGVNTKGELGGKQATPGQTGTTEEGTEGHHIRVDNKGTQKADKQGQTWR